MTAGIFGIGAALPDHVITNGDLEQRLDTNDEWIVRRTGIRERRHLRGDETLADLATRACLLALDDAGRTGAEVDHVIVSTITPDRVTPGLAPEVARVIGAERAAAVDLNAACAGFLYALDQAAALVESGRASVVLVCGAEALSRVTDHDDRGDGRALRRRRRRRGRRRRRARARRRRLRARRRRRAGRPALRRARRAQAAHAGPRGLPPRRARG